MRWAVREERVMAVGLSSVTKMSSKFAKAYVPFAIDFV